MRRGVAIQHPRKYNLDEKELARVSALARIELEDARAELERAHEAAKQMGRGAEGDEADDYDEDEEVRDDDSSSWVEYVHAFVVNEMFLTYRRTAARTMNQWMKTPRPNPSRRMRMTSLNII